MRIAYISDYLPEYHTRAGGADWASWRIGEAVSNEDFFIEYFIRKSNISNHPVRNNVNFVPLIEDILLPGISKYSEVLKWYILQIDPLAFVYFFIRFIFRRPDLVHIHRFRCITFAPIVVSQFLNIPIYLSIYDYWLFCALETLIDYNSKICRRFHGLWCWHCLPKKLVFLQKMLLLYRKEIFDMVLNIIDRFIVLSNASARILRDYGISEDRIDAIPLPYGREFTDEENTESPLPDTLLYTGWIQKRKGLDVLIKALAVVKEQVPTVKLNVIGPDVIWEKEYRRYIDNLIRDLSLSNNVIWYGRQPNEVVRRFIRQSEIVVVPEQWENMSPVIIGECMFNSRPVIGSRLGGIPDFVSDYKTGLLFQPDSPDDLASKILYLLQNKDVAQKMGKEARKSALEIFSTKKIIKKYIDLYKIYETVR